MDLSYSEAMEKVNKNYHLRVYFAENERDDIFTCPCCKDYIPRIDFPSIEQIGDEFVCPVCGHRF